MIRDGRVLLARRPSGAWHCPTGGIEPGDASLEDAAARELREEAGLELLGGRTIRWVDGLSAGRPYVAALVVGTVAAGAQPQPVDGTAEAFGWFGPDDLPERTWDRGIVRALVCSEAVAASVAARAAEGSRP